MKRFHVHVGVQDLDASIRFYSALFGTEPTVRKPDYAKWMVEDPRINFAISRRGSPEVCWNFPSPLQSEGAGKTGCALHPRSRVQWSRGRRHTSIQVKRRHPAFPARWFKAYTCSPR